MFHVERIVAVDCVGHAKCFTWNIGVGVRWLGRMFHVERFRWFALRTKFRRSSNDVDKLAATWEDVPRGTFGL